MGPADKKNRRSVALIGGFLQALGSGSTAAPVIISVVAIIALAAIIALGPVIRSIAPAAMIAVIISAGEALAGFTIVLVSSPVVGAAFRPMDRTVEGGLVIPVVLAGFRRGRKGQAQAQNGQAGQQRQDGTIDCFHGKLL